MISIGAYTGWVRHRRGCTGKGKFRSAGAAQAAIRALIKRGEDPDYGPVLKAPELLEPYHCRHCGSWHFGHKRRDSGEEGSNGAEGHAQAGAQAGSGEERNARWQ